MLENPFLKDLTREQYDLLFPLFEPFSVPSQTLIFKQGDEATYLYLILQGRVAILYKPYDGPRLTLTHLNEGDIFGWSSVVADKTYTSDAVSTTRVDLLGILGTDLRRFYLDHPTAGRSILERLAQSVSPRWLNAKDQIRNLLQNKVFQQE